MGFRRALSVVFARIDKKLKLTDRIGYAARRADECVLEILLHPISYKTFLIGAGTAGITFLLGKLLQELFTKQVVTISEIAYGEGKIHYFSNHQEISATEFMKRVLNQQAKEAVIWPKPSVNFSGTVQDYLKQYGGNYTIKVPKDISVTIEEPSSVHYFKQKEIVEKKPFSSLSLLGASISAGCLAGIAYLLKTAEGVLNKLKKY